MLLTIRTTHQPATDLGFLLHKHPDHVHTREFPFGNATVFYPEATEEACTAAVLLDVDPVDMSVYIEDDEAALSPDSLLSGPIRNRSRVHVNRCRKVNVSVTFNGKEISETFPPAATMKRVKRWAVGSKGFNMSDVDAAEHVLQLSGSAQRPDEDTRSASR